MRTTLDLEKPVLDGLKQLQKKEKIPLGKIASRLTILRQHGVRRLYTADADFRKFDFLEVVNPLA